MTAADEKQQRDALIAQLGLAGAAVLAIPVVFAMLEGNGTVRGRSAVFGDALLALPLTLGVFICTVGAFLLAKSWDLFQSDDGRLFAGLAGLVCGVTAGAVIGAGLQGLDLSKEIESFVQETASEARGGRLGWLVTALLYVGFFAQFYVDTYGPLTALTAVCGGMYFGFRAIKTHYQLQRFTEQRAEKAREAERMEKARLAAERRHRKIEEKLAAERQAAPPARPPSRNIDAAGLAHLTMPSPARPVSHVLLEVPNLGAGLSGVLRWYARPHEQVEAGARIAKITTSASRFTVAAPCAGAVAYAEVTDGTPVSGGQRLGEFAARGTAAPRAVKSTSPAT